MGIWVVKNIGLNRKEIKKMKNTKVAKTEVKLNITREMLKCLNGDGHTIYNKEFYLNKGWPAEFIDSLMYKYESNTGNYKETIFGNNDEKLDSVIGVYSLDFHREVAYRIGAKPTTKMGRGFQAQELRANIIEKLEEDGLLTE